MDKLLDSPQAQSFDSMEGVVTGEPDEACVLGMALVRVRQLKKAEGLLDLEDSSDPFGVETRIRDVVRAIAPAEFRRAEIYTLVFKIADRNIPVDLGRTFTMGRFRDFDGPDFYDIMNVLLERMTDQQLAIIKRMRRPQLKLITKESASVRIGDVDYGLMTPEGGECIGLFMEKREGADATISCPVVVIFDEAIFDEDEEPDLPVSILELAKARENFSDVASYYGLRRSNPNWPIALFWEIK